MESNAELEYEDLRVMGLAFGKADLCNEIPAGWWRYSVGLLALIAL